MVKVLANGPEDRGLIQSKVIPKTHKMVLDSALHHTQHYKVQIKGKVDQSMKRSAAVPYISVSAIEKEAIRSTSTTVANFTFYLHMDTTEMDNQQQLT